jgi:SAM-dependent methyltransferase
MLDWGHQALLQAELTDRVSLHACHLPHGDAPHTKYDLVLSNSLLHHLDDPAVLWQSVKRWSLPGGPVFVMDLYRPETPLDVERLVEAYAAGDPDVLRRDFASSLAAAYRPDEVRAELERAGLAHLAVEVVSDRHFVVWGSQLRGLQQ